MRSTFEYRTRPRKKEAVDTKSVQRIENKAMAWN